MSVTFIYRQKMDFSICDNMVGFPKYSHISDFKYWMGCGSPMVQCSHAKLTTLSGLVI